MEEKKCIEIDDLAKKIEELIMENGYSRLLNFSVDKNGHTITYEL